MAKGYNFLFLILDTLKGAKINIKLHEVDWLGVLVLLFYFFFSKLESNCVGALDLSSIYRVIASIEIIKRDNIRIASHT